MEGSAGRLPRVVASPRLAPRASFCARAIVLDLIWLHGCETFDLGDCAEAGLLLLLGLPPAKA
eukprot:7314629-Alexandrium_andersonii.AAC.1